MTDFPHKLGEWTEHEIDVPSFEAVVNDKAELVGIKRTTKKAIEKIRYDEVPFKKMSCAAGQHQWFMMDKRKHVAACKLCSKHLFLNPIRHKLKDHHIVDRDTDEVLID